MQPMRNENNTKRNECTQCEMKCKQYETNATNAKRKKQCETNATNAKRKKQYETNVTNAKRKQYET